MLFDPSLTFPESYESFVFPTDEIGVSSVLTEVGSRYTKDEFFLRSFSSFDVNTDDLTETDCLMTDIDNNESLVDIIDIQRYSTLTRLITVTALTSSSQQKNEKLR